MVTPLTAMAYEAVRGVGRSLGIPDPVTEVFVRLLRPCVYLCPYKELPEKLREGARPAARAGGPAHLPEDVAVPAYVPHEVTVDWAAIPTGVLDIEFPADGHIAILTEVTDRDEGFVIHLPAGTETVERHPRETEPNTLRSYESFPLYLYAVAGMTTPGALRRSHVLEAVDYAEGDAERARLVDSLITRWGRFLPCARATAFSSAASPLPGTTHGKTARTYCSCPSRRARSSAENASPSFRVLGSRSRSAAVRAETQPQRQELPGYVVVEDEQDVLDRAGPAPSTAPATATAKAAKWLDQRLYDVVHDPRPSTQTITNGRILTPAAPTSTFTKIVLRARRCGCPQSRSAGGAVGPPVPSRSKRLLLEVADLCRPLHDSESSPADGYERPGVTYLEGRLGPDSHLHRGDPGSGQGSTA